MKRRRFLKVIVGIITCGSIAYSYRFLGNVERNELVETLLLKDSLGFSVKCALASGGIIFIEAALNQKGAAVQYGQIEIIGYLLNPAEFDGFIVALKGYMVK